MFPRVFERRFVGAAFEHLVAFMDDQPDLGQTIQQQVGPVFTIVGIDQEVRKPDGAVIGKPFEQVRAFVFDRRDKEDAFGDHKNYRFWRDLSVIRPARPQMST